MTEYRVRWEIDVDADSPEEAARKAQAIQRRYDSTATVFDVIAHYFLPPAGDWSKLSSSRQIDLASWDFYYVEGANLAFSGTVTSENLHWEDYPSAFAKGYADAKLKLPHIPPVDYDEAELEAYNLGRYEAEQG